MKASTLLLTITMVIILSMATLIWFFPPNGDFRVENPFWNGLSTFNLQTESVAINSFSDLPAQPTKTAFFLVPYEPFSGNKLAQLKEYVSNGGILVVLDDYGYGNQVLDGIGVELRFTGKPLLDPLFDYKSKWLPKITGFAETPLASNISSIVFNHASCLNETKSSTIVAYSSRFSFIDLNDNGVGDIDEPIGPIPVIAYTKIDQGYVVAIADPSLLINGMIELDDNRQILSNIAYLQGSSVQFFVDQTHLPKSSLDAAKESLASIYELVSSPVGTLSLIVVVLVLSLKPIWRIGGKFGDKQSRN